MKRWLVRPLAWIAGGAALLIALAAGAIRLDQYSLRWKAERLQSDIRSLELRKSTYTDARRVIDRWMDDARENGPCRSDWCDIEFNLGDLAWVHNQFVFRTSVRSRIFRLLGARPAIVGASIRVRNDLLIGKTVEEYVGGSCHEFRGQTFCLTVMGHVGMSSCRRIDYRHPEYSFSKPSGCEYCVDANVLFSSYADPDDVRRLTDVNFTCITQWTPCETESDVLPTAWAESENEGAQIPGRPDSCAGTIRALSRQLQHVPLATAIDVIDVGEGPQITIRWEEQPELAKAEGQRKNVPVPSAVHVRKGDRLLVFEKELFQSFNSCAIVPATDENLQVAQEGVRDDLSDHVNPLNLPFGEIKPPHVNIQ